MEAKRKIKGKKQTLKRANVNSENDNSCKKP
jgi:hypothetical protein